MRRILFILMLVPVLLWSTAQSADLLETYKDYRFMMRQLLGTDTTDKDYLSDTLANQMTRLSVSVVLPATRAIKTVLWDTTEFKKDAYTLDTTVTGIIAVQWRHNDTLKSLVHTPMEQWNQLLIKRAGDASPNASSDRRPFVYDYIDGTVFIHPIPIEIGDSLRIIAWRRVPSIAAVDSLSLIPQQYRHPIVLYAAWQIARARQHGGAKALHEAFIEAMAMVNASLNRKGTAVAPTD